MKVAFSATVMLWMLISSRAMVSGASDPPLLRSISPVMVAPGMPDKPFFTVPVNLPPLMVAVFSTQPEMTPPEIFPAL